MLIIYAIVITVIAFFLLCVICDMALKAHTRREQREDFALHTDDALKLEPHK